MLARHAENLFWAGRYIERAEDTARMLDVTYHGLLEAMPWEQEPAWLDLLRTLRSDHAFLALDRPVRAGAVSEFLVFDRTNPGSIVSAVSRGRENTRAVRELVSTEVWEAINTFWLELQGRNLRADVETQPYELYGLVKRRCQGVAGVVGETMPRDDGWRFFMLGWLLERAEMMCRLLEVRYAQAEGNGIGPGGGFHHWMQTLKSASGAEAFRKAYRSSMEPADVVEFLLLSRTFPRSVLYCLGAAEEQLRALSGRPQGADAGGLTRPQRLLGRCRSDLEFVDVQELLASGLVARMERLQGAVRQVAEAVATQYFRASQELDLHVQRVN